MAVIPDNIGLDLALGLAHRFQKDDGAGPFQLMGLRHEIVLSAHTGHDAPVFQRIGGHCAKAGCLHRDIDEPRIHALTPAHLFIAIERIHIVDRGHVDEVQDVVRRLPQRAVEILRPQIEPAIDGDIAPFMSPAGEDTGAQDLEHALGEHFGTAIEALNEGRLAALLHRPGGTRQRAHGILVFGLVGMAQPHRLRGPVTQRADTDLQRPAILDEARRPQPDGMAGQIDARGRRTCQVIGARIQQHVELIGRHFGIIRHERQLLIELPDHQKLVAANLLAHQRNEIEAEV